MNGVNFNSYNSYNNYNSYNSYNLNNNNNANYWNEMIFMIHEMNFNEMFVPVHNRDYLLGVLSADSESSSGRVGVGVETPVEIFKRLEINVTKADDKVQTQSEEKKKEDCCSVCKEDFTDIDIDTDKDEIVTTGCNHLFHACCLATWVKTKKTCPNCREPLVNLFL